MSKQEFLKKLNYKLRKLKKSERKKYIDYYDEMISDIMDNGISEEDAIERQGSVEEIASDIIANTAPGNLRVTDWRGIVLAIGSICMLLICMIPVLLKAQFGIRMNASIGIIGGADGPTSVFIAGKLGTPWGLYMVTGILLACTIIYWIRKRNSNKNT